MAESTGKCTNFASCTLAYRNQPIPYVDNPVCPECGQPLVTKTTSKGPSPVILIAAGAGLLVVAAVALYFVFFHHKASPAQTTASQQSQEASPSTPAPAPEPEPASTTPSVASTTPATPATPAADTPATSILAPSPSAPPPPDQPTTPPSPPSTTPDSQPPIGSLPNPQTEAEPAGPVSVESKIDTNIQGDENLRVRTEVLKRIDLMPNLSPGDREKLYGRVDRAHGMGKVITIPFAMGSRAVGARETDQLKSALQSPQVARLVKDPTVVFVLLGFADKRGDEKANQKISLDRAENISQTLKEKCGMQNVTQPVGMGGSALFDSGNFAKNRVVEVWAVVP